MNPFTKEWITSTCAPESITNMRHSTKADLDCIRNEDKTIKVFVLSNNTEVLAIGVDYVQLLDSKSYTFKEALHKVTKLLQLQSVSTK